MVEILRSNPETDIQNDLDELKKSIKANPDKDPDGIFDSDPAAVKEIDLSPEYITNAKEFFVYMTEYLNKNIDDIGKINTLRKELNKGIRTSNAVLIDGRLIARPAVTSLFALENGEVVLKNYSEEKNGEKIYDIEAKVKTSMYASEQVLLFETDDKEYDYNIVLFSDGKVSIVQKSTKKTKELKLTNEAEIIKFESFLKEIFPPAYVTYFKQAMEEIKNKEADKDNNKKNKKK